MQRKARHLLEGDVFRIHAYGTALAVTPVAERKRIKVLLKLEDPERRANRGAFISDKGPGCAFTDAGLLLSFSARPAVHFTSMNVAGTPLWRQPWKSDPRAAARAQEAVDYLHRLVLAEPVLNRDLEAVCRYA
jgi:hypothetical protein